MGYLLLPATPSVRLVQQPRAENRVHVDSNALDTEQQDRTWIKSKDKLIK